jgi:prohibitin 1
MKLKNTLIGMGVVTALALGAWGFYEARSQWVDAGYVGILYNASGGIQPDVIKPQRVFVGWRQKLYTYPTKLQAAKYVEDASEGEVKAADGILITTSDNANTTFDVCMVYRIRPEDAIDVFKNFGPIDIEQIQSQHLRRAIKEAVNEVGPRYDVFELMGPKRADFCAAATESLKKRLVRKGITVEQLMLMTAYPETTTREKINRRVNQYTELDIAKLRGQIAEVQSKTNIITAQAKADAAKLTGTSVAVKSLEQLQLQADEEAVEKWDGRLPAIRTGGNQTVIVDSQMLSRLGNSGARQTAPAQPGGGQ